MGGTTLSDAQNGFNKLSRLEMLWNVCHHWPEGARFVFNLYKHWLQLISLSEGSLSVTLLIREGVTQIEPLSAVLCIMAFVTLAEELWASDLGLLTPFYAYDMAFNRMLRRSTHLLNLLLDRGSDWGDLPDPSESLFLSNSPNQ